MTEEIKPEENMNEQTESNPAHSVEENGVSKKNKWKTSSYFLLGLLAVSVIFGLSDGYNQFNALILGNEGTSTSDMDTVAQDAIKYINENLLADGAEAEFINVSEENGMYKISFNLIYSGGEQYYDSYITKDGKLLFPDFIDMTEEIISYGDETEEETAMTCDDITKAETPEMQAFVVSYCPYGTQMQRILAEVVSNIPELAENIKARYMGAVVDGAVTAMHGDEEAQENLRQICIREEQSDKYWNYISCFIKEGDTEGCLAEAEVDETILNGCMADADKGIKYAEEDFALTDSFGVSGSPTLILNDERVSEFDFGGRTANAVKTLLCCGFGEMPGYCSEELTTVSASTGFAEGYSAGSTSTGSC